jgi:hypothetical protein
MAFLMRRIRYPAAIALLLGLLLPARSAAQPAVPTEYQVKAAFLYNFAKFVEWPIPASPDANAVFSICILGQDPFSADLEAVVRDQMVQGKPLMIKRAQHLQDFGACQILFVASSEQDRLRSILDNVPRGVLTVGDEMPQFTATAGMVVLMRKGGYVRFAINVDAAGRAGLKISSKLLNLAVIVHDAQAAGER